MGRSRIVCGSATRVACRATLARALAQYRSHCCAASSRAGSVVFHRACCVWDPASLAPTLTLPRKRGRESALARHIKDRDRLAEAFQREVADLCEADIGFDRAGDPLRDQDLAVG